MTTNAETGQHACIYCGSTDLVFSDTRKGVSVGRSVAGAALLGPLGLAAGAVGRNKVTVTARCNGCFKTYPATQLLRRRQPSQAGKIVLAAIFGIVVMFIMIAIVAGGR